MPTVVNAPSRVSTSVKSLDWIMPQDATSVQIMPLEARVLDRIMPPDVGVPDRIIPFEAGIPDRIMPLEEARVLDIIMP